MNSPRCPSLWSVYVLMFSKEEWDLVQLGSQHNCVERPIWPVFPDYLSVSCDYDSMVVGAPQSFQFFRQITWFLRNNTDLSKLKYWTLDYLIVIIKLQNN